MSNRRKIVALKPVVDKSKQLSKYPLLSSESTTLRPEDKNNRRRANWWDDLRRSKFSE